jgi:hypothetical protein
VADEVYVVIDLGVAEERFGTPSLTTRAAGVMVLGGETNLFSDDHLVIVPATDSPSSSEVVLMQYQVVEFHGAQPPTEAWQPASLQLWRREQQWCFQLPCGQMKVRVRCIDRACREVTASDPSEELEFLVQGEPTSLGTCHAMLTVTVNKPESVSLVCWIGTAGGA